jgi:hypothetical protein
MEKCKEQKQEMIFIHKLGVVLKELKRMQNRSKDHSKKGVNKTRSKEPNELFKETEELIAIIAKSIETAEKNKDASKK